MDVGVVQLDYEQLTTISQLLEKQAAYNEVLYRKLVNSTVALRQSGWEGRGAHAFFSEMSESVLPTINRLIDALQYSQIVTLEIVKIVKDAEENAANLFNAYGDGNVFKEYPSTLISFSANSSNSTDSFSDFTVLSSNKIPLPQNKPTPPELPLGSLSEKYESGGRGPGTVSGGKGDYGGVSYGTYQLSTKMKTVEQFLQNEGSTWQKEFAGLVPGSKEFSEKWREVAGRDSDFGIAQHDYIKRTHYDVYAAKVFKEQELDLSNHSRALQDVIWSTAVQHGPKNSIVSKALSGKDISKMSDSEIIKAIYTERSRTNAQGELVYFQSSSLTVQKGVAKRFRDELEDALEMLKE